MSTVSNSASKGDISESVLMPGDPLRAKFIAENYLSDAFLYNSIRNMYGYTGRYKGVSVSVQGSGMGMPSMGIYSHELFRDYDVQRIIRIGTCGSFRADLSPGSVILAIAASTDSNYQHTFGLSGSFSPSASWDLLCKARDVSDELGIPVTAGNIVSCDVFYEADPDWWRKWAALGVLGVEMEAAALYMNAAASGRDALCIVTVSDDFNTGARSSLEEREKSFTSMMELALETAVR